MQEFGLVLGGGGVKGLAHLALLKKLDEMKLRPKKIAGTSMGAILGALYASGLSGIEIEERVRKHLYSRKESVKENYKRRKHLAKWLKVFRIEKSRGGIISANGLFEHLFDEIIDKDFSELTIPFTAVSADFHNGEEIAIQSGPVLPAVQASMAVPGVFAPVKHQNRLLIDGGAVNNVPCAHVADPTNEHYKVIASDVICLSDTSSPKTTEVVSGAFSIMIQAQTQRQFDAHPPDFIFRPDTRKIDAFDFHKITLVLERGDEAIRDAEKNLEMLFRKV